MEVTPLRTGLHWPRKPTAAALYKELLTVTTYVVPYAGKAQVLTSEVSVANQQEDHEEATDWVKTSFRILILNSPSHRTRP